jgi:protein O-GlcNAc transferase
VLRLAGRDLHSAREAIAALRPDILFYQDIGMEPMSYFLAMARLAPVQVTWFGHPDTTGIANMDCFLSWENFETADSPAHYSERLLLSQATGNIACYRRPAGEDRTLTRASFGFAEDDHLYCCAQQAYKLMPAMDRLFDDVLRHDPRAVIVLFEPLQTYLREAVENRLLKNRPQFAGRIRFLPMQGYAAYLRVLQLSDVVLDSVPFNGYNTTLDALAMGTPVVTLAGKPCATASVSGFTRPSDSTNWSPTARRITSDWPCAWLPMRRSGRPAGTGSRPAGTGFSKTSPPCARWSG